jgi:meso-butanediol dehydrogenase / (S,S)-butanediol dehydrogenase / diacetyl reductase
MRLKGKVALVTGAASGIGQAIAKLMAQEGAQVAIADINDQGGQETVAEIGEEAAFYKHTDVGSNTEVQSLVEATVARFGAIDILVNNAAIVLFKRLIDTEPDEWDKVIATNLRSVYLCSRYTIPHMMRRGHGTIVNISSARALATTPLVSSYDASKGAIVSLTRSLALEYANHGIRVNCVLPGAIDTPVFRANLRADGREEEQYRATVDHIPLGRVGLPVDIAQAVVFLTSEESSYMTGASFLVDGGLLAQA